MTKQTKSKPEPAKPAKAPKASAKASPTPAKAPKASAKASRPSDAASDASSVGRGVEDVAAAEHAGDPRVSPGAELASRPAMERESNESGAGLAEATVEVVSATATSAAATEASSSEAPSSEPSSSGASSASEPADVMEPRLWKKSGWVAKVIKNEEDDGWAVEMTRQGDSEPALVGPWTMGRDKKNPKPLDQSAFLTLVKTATEVLRRHEQAALARLQKTIAFGDDQGRRLKATVRIVPDEDDPHAILTVEDELGELLTKQRVPASFKPSATSVLKLLASGGEG